MRARGLRRPTPTSSPRSRSPARSPASPATSAAVAGRLRQPRAAGLARVGERAADADPRRHRQPARRGARRLRFALLAGCASRVADQALAAAHGRLRHRSSSCCCRAASRGPRDALRAWRATRRWLSRSLARASLTRRFGGLAAVDRVSLDLRQRRDPRADRHQRRRQVDADQPALRRARAERRQHRVPRRARVRARPERWRAGIGRSYQRTTIFGEFSALENCRLAAQARRRNRGRLKAPTSAGRATTPRRARWPRPASTLGEASAPASSRTARRQLEIAMCLATAPHVLLLDEPLAGMGAEESQQY